MEGALGLVEDVGGGAPEEVFCLFSGFFFPRFRSLGLGSKKVSFFFPLGAGGDKRGPFPIEFFFFSPSALSPFFTSIGREERARGKRKDIFFNINKKRLETHRRTMVQASLRAHPEKCTALSSPIMISSMRSQRPRRTLPGSSKVEAISPPVAAARRWIFFFFF